MAIQKRRGNDVDFDPGKMLPGEDAVSVDKKKMYVAFAPGDVKEVAFKDDVPDEYALPIATSQTLGGVKPVLKTNAMTQPVGIDSEGRLFAKPIPTSSVDGVTVIDEVMEFSNISSVTVVDEVLQF